MFSLRHGLTEGTIDLTAARISGLLDLGHASLNEASHELDGSHERADTALSADMLTADQGIIGVGLRARGTIVLTGAAIGHDLNLRDARIEVEHDEATALNLERATVAGTLDLRLIHNDHVDAPRGGIDLSHTVVGAVIDDHRSWPAWLELEGFKYSALPADDSRSWRMRLDWARLHRLA